jgi:acetyl esterase/lipase
MDVYPAAANATANAAAGAAAATAAAHPAPYVLFFHGGLWYSGARTEIDEVCRQVVARSNGTVGCATADYSYSQDLPGGSCQKGGAPTFEAQAAQVRAALAALRARPGVDGSRVLLGGHSAGGHLAAWLSLNWGKGAAAAAAAAAAASPAASSAASAAASAASSAAAAPPLAFAGVEGIYNASLWDAYQAFRWKGGFHCADWQCFGDPAAHWADGWLAGSPVVQAAAGVAPAGPVLLIHSPQDDYVQSEQARALYAALGPPASGAGAHRLDVGGACVSGEHPAVLEGGSAATLAQCMLTFLADAEAARPPPRGL